MMNRTFEIRYTPADTDGGFSFSNMDTEYSATSRYLTRGGKPILPICGEIHFSRCERQDWKRELLKMKECGLTTVANYVFWNHHEQKKGHFRWDGNRILPSWDREAGRNVCAGFFRTGGAASGKHFRQLLFGYGGGEFRGGKASVGSAGL